MELRKVGTRMAVVAGLLVAVARPTPAASLKGPCAADAQRFCHDVPVDRPHIMQCLREHRSELSVECKQHVEAVRAGRQKRRQACQPDIQTFCKDVPPGRGRFLKCLKEHAAELSPACKSAIAKPPAKP
jgi:hypothetical protein